MSTTKAVSAALSLMAFVVVGCGDPCVDLSKKICHCEPTERLQQACSARVDNDSGAPETTDAMRQRCAELEDTCTCEALASGDLAACGLANDSGLPADAGADGD